VRLAATPDHSEAVGDWKQHRLHAFVAGNAVVELSHPDGVRISSRFLHDPPMPEMLGTFKTPKSAKSG
jgi:hypothetical protein